MNKLQFILNDIIREIDFNNSVYSPTTTVLKYLRSLPGHKGVKEGCAEGDCGACTVVLAHFDGKNMKYKAVNSCLMFLPMLQGKQLIIVENLQDADRVLHPVQSAMIDHFGSQCGYCTPGIIMNLFAAYKNNHTLEKHEIVKTLSGNLCRCTGYKQIIEAANSAFSNIHEDHFSKKEKVIIKLLKEIKIEKTLEFVIDKQIYVKPANLDETYFYLLQMPDAILITGNTDIALKVTKRNEIIPEIIDISDIEELKFIRNENNIISIGSGTCIEEIRISLQKYLPSLSDMMSYFGSRQIRNLASLGGNIGSASPIGDTLPVLIALEASVILKNGVNTRKIELEKFIRSYRKTDIQADELIYSVEIPVPNPDKLIKSYKVSKRREMDISTVSACFSLELDKIKNTVTSIIMTYGGMAAVPKRAIQTEIFLTNRKWDQSNIDEAMIILKKEFEPISDARSGSEFRRIISANLLQTFYNESVAENHNMTQL